MDGGALERLLVNPRPDPRRYVWATVAQLDPLRLRPDGDVAWLAPTADASGAELSVGARVWCLWDGPALTIAGIAPSSVVPYVPPPPPEPYVLPEQGQFATARLSLDLSYATARYAVLQWTDSPITAHTGGLTLPASPSAWVYPGAGRWHITLSLAVPGFTSATAPFYAYIVRQLDPASPFVTSALPNYSQALRIAASPGGGGVEVSAHVTLSGGQNISALLYHNSGSSFSLGQRADPAWNHLRFVRMS